jgi:sucrose-6-phosphate hydrolase SacC (GH32 family)
VTLHHEDFPEGHGTVQILIDKAVAELFVSGGRRYIVHELPASDTRTGLACKLEGTESTINHLTIYDLKSIWADSVRFQSP